MNYATLTQVRQYLGAAASDVADDTKLAFFLKEASNFIRTHYRRCDPFKDTRNIDYPAKPVQLFGHYSLQQWVDEINLVGELGAGKLELPDDLLELVSITNGDGTAIALSDVITLPEGSFYPKHTIQLQPSSGKVWLPASSGNVKQVIPVVGIWGWHDRYDETAWIDTLDTVEDNPLSNSATTITVNDADGLDENLETPRFQAGHLLKVESEFMLVTSVNTTNNTLTVKRAVQGTTAVAHAQNTLISTFVPGGSIRLATIRLAVWRYRQKDANVFDKTTILATGVQITPSSIPPDVVDLLPKPRVPTFSQ